MKPELEDHRAFIAEHFFQALRTGDCLVQDGILEQAVNPALEHLAVPVAKKHAHAALGRQLTPVAPGRRVGQFLIGLAVKSAYLDQPRVHPLTEQLDRLALAGTLYAIDQHNDRRALLLLQFVLGFKQGFTQGGSFSVVGFFIDDMTDFCGFEHGKLPGKMSQA